MEAFAAQLFDAIDSADSADLIPALAVPLPLMVIADVLGVPQDELPRLRTWSLAMTPAIVDPLHSAHVVYGANRAVGEAKAYFAGLLHERMETPADDATSLLAASVAAGALAEDDALATLIFLLIAGNETTANLIGQVIYQLLLHPDRRARTLADRAVLQQFIEEVLRLHSPVQGLRRSPSEDVVLHGKLLKRGMPVRAMFAAANRDPEQFADPALFDASRTDGRHLAFGYGAHFCLGAALSRLEAAVAVDAFFRRFPNATLASSDPPPLRPITFIRGLDALPVRLR
jgi:cytochrome P450